MVITVHLCTDLAVSPVVATPNLPPEIRAKSDSHPLPPRHRPRRIERYQSRHIVHFMLNIAWGFLFAKNHMTEGGGAVAPELAPES